MHRGRCVVKLDRRKLLTNVMAEDARSSLTLVPTSVIPIRDSFMICLYNYSAAGRDAMPLHICTKGCMPRLAIHWLLHHLLAAIATPLRSDRPAQIPVCTTSLFLRPDLDSALLARSILHVSDHILSRIHRDAGHFPGCHHQSVHQCTLYPMFH
jgi:hypothetical protein